MEQQNPASVNQQKTAQKQIAVQRQEIEAIQKQKSGEIVQQQQVQQIQQQAQQQGSENKVAEVKESQNKEGPVKQQKINSQTAEKSADVSLGKQGENKDQMSSKEQIKVEKQQQAQSKQPQQVRTKQQNQGKITVQKQDKDKVAVQRQDESKLTQQRQEQSKQEQGQVQQQQSEAEQQQKDKGIAQQIQQDMPAKAVLSAFQICQLFLANYKPNSQIKIKDIDMLQQLVEPHYQITKATLDQFFQQGKEDYSIESFKQWLGEQEQKQAQQYQLQFETSPEFNSIKILESKALRMVELATSRNNTLKIEVGVGQNRHKTSLRYAAALGNTKKKEGEGLSSKQAANNKGEGGEQNGALQGREGRVVIELQIVVKRRGELRAMLQNQIKRLRKSNQYHIFKFCEVQFEQTEKTLKITILSNLLEQVLFKDLIAEITSKVAEGASMRVEGELTAKNSLRKDENTLIDRPFVKWLAEGIHCRSTMQGSAGLIKHLTSPLAEYSPIFGVIRSGQVNIQLGEVASVDKLFDRLGVNGLCEETPNLSAFLLSSAKEYLGVSSLPWVGQLLRRSMLFTNTMAGQKVSWQVRVHISHLSLQVGYSAESCKEMADVVWKTFVEEFN